MTPTSDLQTVDRRPPDPGPGSAVPPTSTKHVGERPRRIDLGRYALVGVTTGLALMTVFPMAFVVSSALKPTIEVFDGRVIPRTPTLENLRYVLTEVPFPRYMLNSLLIALVATLAGLLVHSMAAYALARLRFPGRDMVFFGFFSTVLVSLPVILVPLFIVVRQLGLVNTYAGVILPMIFHLFALFLLRQFYLGLPREVEEQAKVDGCGHLRVYLSVVLPLSRPVFAALGIFMFLGAWNAFLWPLTVLTEQDLWTVQIGISTFKSEFSGSWNYVMAASLITAFPTVAMFLVFQRQIIESIKTTGMK